MSGRLQHTWAMLALAILTLPGCTSSGGVSSDAPPPERQQFIAAAEPEGATAIETAKAAVEKGFGEVVIVGQILSGQFDPFQADKATFVLSELPDDGHAHKGHDSKDCPFCKRRAAKAPKAVVQCNDRSGQPLPIAAPKLLGIAPNQVVVVQGKGTVDPELNLFVVEANRVYIRP